MQYSKWLKRIKCIGHVSGCSEGGTTTFVNSCAFIHSGCRDSPKTKFMEAWRLPKVGFSDTDYVLYFSSSLVFYPLEDIPMLEQILS